MNFDYSQKKEVISRSLSPPTFGLFCFLWRVEGDDFGAVTKLINYVFSSRVPPKIHQYFTAGKFSVHDTSITGARTMHHVVCFLTLHQVLLV